MVSVMLSRSATEVVAPVCSILFYCVMRLFNMPPQIVRLCLVTIGIVGSYLVARAVLTPPSFREYGFFRGDALKDIMALPPQYGGKVSCDECHSDQFTKLNKGGHKRLSCEVCHGPGYAHTQSPDAGMHKPTFTVCSKCHEANPSRPKTHKQIVLKEHYAGGKCMECHVPHSPAEVP